MLFSLFPAAGYAVPLENGIRILLGYPWQTNSHADEGDTASDVPLLLKGLLIVCGFVVFCVAALVLAWMYGVMWGAVAAAFGVVVFGLLAGAWVTTLAAGSGSEGQIYTLPIKIPYPGRDRRSCAILKSMFAV